MAYRRSRGLTFASGWRVAVVVWCAVSFLVTGNDTFGAELTAQEKQAIRALVVKQSQRVASVFTKFDRIETYSNAHDLRHLTYEWAMSGEKRYRKRWWAAPVGEPLPGRWGIAVWDGKFLKAYDSELDNGSIRAEHDPRKDQPRTYSPYAQLLGSLNYGTLADLLTKIEPENWQAEWAVPGKKAVFRTNYVSEPDGATMRAWTLDLDRGGLITRYDITVRRKPGQEYEPFLTWEISEAREVEPGLWLPTRAHSRMEFERPGRAEKEMRETDLVVTELKVNDPSIEDKFQFTFPDGAMYYDFVLDSSMVAGGGIKVSVDATLDELSDDLQKVMAEKERRKEEGKRERGDGGKEPDDFDIADRLTGGPIASAKVATGSSSKLPWTALGVFCFVVAGAVLIYGGIRRSRRQRSDAEKVD